MQMHRSFFCSGYLMYHLFHTHNFARRVYCLVWLRNLAAITSLKSINQYLYNETRCVFFWSTSLISCCYLDLLHESEVEISHFSFRRKRVWTDYRLIRYSSHFTVIIQFPGPERMSETFENATCVLFSAVSCYLLN